MSSCRRVFDVEPAIVRDFAGSCTSERAAIRSSSRKCSSRSWTLGSCAATTAGGRAGTSRSWICRERCATRSWHGCERLSSAARTGRRHRGGARDAGVVRRPRGREWLRRLRRWSRRSTSCAAIACSSTPRRGSASQYDFTHPTLQATLYSELGKARTRLLHGRIADGARANVRRARQTRTPTSSRSTFRAQHPSSWRQKPRDISLAAGRSALARYATREAATYLGAALDIVDRECCDAQAHGFDRRRWRRSSRISRARSSGTASTPPPARYGNARSPTRASVTTAARISSIERRLGLGKLLGGRA